MDPWLLIVVLGGCALVGGLMLPRTKTPGSDQMQAVQVQESLEAFMQSIESDNRELVEAVAAAAQEQREDNAARDARLAALERRCQELEQLTARTEGRLESQMQALRHGLAARPAAEPARADAPAAAEGPRETPASAIRSRYPELFQLHDAGKSVDLIAKKVGMNKGEVLLILQLSRQEEAHRV